MALADEATVFLSGGGQAAQLTVLVHRVADPVNTGVVADGLVGGVHKDNLKVLVHSILVHPVRIEHTQTAALATDTLLGNVAQVAGRLQLSNTLVNGLTVDNTLQIKETM